MSQPDDKPARIAMRVADLTDDDMALIMAARVPPEHDYRLADIDDRITLANPAGLDLSGVEPVRAAGESDEDFKAAKDMYRKLLGGV